MLNKLLSFTEGPKGYFVIFDYVVSLLAIIVNAVVLQSVIRAHIPLTGYKYFLISLGISDLYLCCINIAIFVIDAARHYSNVNSCWGSAFRSIQLSGYIANLLNLSGMSFDHLMGVVYPLNYARIMKKKSLKIGVIMLWLLATALGSVELVSATIVYLEKRQTMDPAPMNISPQLGNCTNFFMDSSSTNFSIGSYSFPNSSQEFNISFLDLPGVQLPKDREETSSLELRSQHQLFKEEVKLPQTIQSAYDDFDGSDLKVNGSYTVKNETDKQYDCFMEDFFNMLDQITKQKKDTLTWCAFYHREPYLEYAIMGLTLTCFLVIAFCYAKVFKEFFNKSRDDAPKKNARKLVMTTFLLLGAFVICYVPFMIFEMSMVIAMQLNVQSILQLSSSGKSSYFMIAHNIFNTLLVTSPLLQPLLYAGRLSIVRRQLVRDLRNCPLLPLCLKQRFLQSSMTESRQDSESMQHRLSASSKKFEYETGASNLCSCHSTLNGARLDRLHNVHLKNIDNTNCNRTPLIT